MNESTTWQTCEGTVTPGHKVASGGNDDPRFPGGTLRMQTPFFRALGLDFGRFHAGTLNVSIAPHAYRVVRAKHTFRQVKWHPTEPAEDFSFFDVRVTAPDGTRVDGLIYHPHPETKPEHLQRPDVLELLLPFVPGIAYGTKIGVHIPAKQMIISLPDNA